MMKKLVYMPFCLCLFTTFTAQARVQPYLELDGGYTYHCRVLDESDWAEARFGIGTHYFPDDHGGFFLGLDAHVGTNFGGTNRESDIGWDRKKETISFSYANETLNYDSFSIFTAEAAGMIGYEFKNQVEIAFKIGVQYLSEPEPCTFQQQWWPELSLGLAFPLTQHLKLTTELDTIVLFSAVRAGLRYQF